MATASAAALLLLLFPAYQEARLLALGEKDLNKDWGAWHSSGERSPALGGHGGRGAGIMSTAYPQGRLPLTARHGSQTHSHGGLEGACMPSEYLEWVVVDIKRAFIMCQIPKAANEMWLMYLRRLNGAKDWSNPEMTMMSARGKNGLVYATARSKVPGVREALRGAGGSVQRFIVTRHPVTRFFSAFENKIRRRKGSKFRDIYNVSKGVSVEDFIDRLASMRYTEVDVHFKPQWFLCGACEGGITYDRLFRYENLPEAWSWFQRHLGHLRPDELPSRNDTTNDSRKTQANDLARQWAQRNRQVPSSNRIAFFHRPFRWNIATDQTRQQRRAALALRLGALLHGTSW
mmetsp:Transcript_45600/g.145219  ORF Transcript_45600/g.145219 Transcript_45600/m.145219 type:complete len:346 (-) Transcript_45600:743-1780(-)